jgi:hypothetical protein
MRKAALAALTLLVCVGEAQAQDAPAPCPPGVYLLDNPADLTGGKRIEMKLSEKRKLAGLGGFMLTGGLSGIKIKSVLAGPNAAVRTRQSKPVFRFCIPAPLETVVTSNNGSEYVGTLKIAQNPNEFLLIAYDGKSKKDRQVAISKSTMGGIAGIPSESMVRFTVTQEAPAIFMASANQPMASGEYGFIRAVGGGAVPGAKVDPKGLEQVFDFAVEGIAAKK